MCEVLLSLYRATSQCDSWFLPGWVVQESDYKHPATATAAAKSLQSCPTLCDPIDGSPPGSAIPGILQARTLGWVAISFSNAWKWKVKGESLSRVRLFATPWTAAYHAPLSMGFSRRGVEYDLILEVTFQERCWLLFIIGESLNLAPSYWESNTQGMNIMNQGPMRPS